MQGGMRNQKTLKITFNKYLQRNQGGLKGDFVNSGQILNLHQQIYPSNSIPQPYPPVQMKMLLALDSGSTLGSAKSIDLPQCLTGNVICTDLKPTQSQDLEEEDQSNNLKKSLIDQLADIENTNPLFPPLDKNGRNFKLFECEEASSVRESDSDDEGDEISEVVDLTPQEDDYFHTFIQPSSDSYGCLENRRSQQPIASLQSSKRLSREESQPENKTKVIRNFFRPKDSIIKNDDKTCCNSQIWAESKLIQGVSKLKTLNLQELTSKLRSIE